MSGHHVRQLVLAAICLAIIAVIGALLVFRPRAPVFPPAKARLSTSATYVGVYEHTSPLSFTPYAAFGSQVFKPSIALYYSRWNEDFQIGFATSAWKAGAITLVQIDPNNISLNDIAAGHYDRYLRKYAKEVRDFQHPVIIGFGHEMNGSWYSWGDGHQSPSLFTSAWRHIVKLFRREGAGNVTWMWTISSNATKLGRLIVSYWPGSAYVDWIGIDGYYRQPQTKFAFVYYNAISQVRQMTSKPILLSEVGVGKQVGQARQIPGLFAGIIKNHLLGLVWFDEDKTGTGAYNLDWRLEGNAAAIAAFRAGVTSLAHIPHPHASIIPPSASPSPSRS